MNLRNYLRLEPYILIWIMLCLTIYATFRLERLAPLTADGKLDDPMITSGYFVAIFGLWLSLLLDRFFNRLSRQIEHDGVIKWSVDDSDAMQRRRIRYSAGLAGIVTLTLAGGFLIFHFRGLPTGFLDWEFFLSALFVGAMAGHRLGAGAAYGHVGHFAAHPETRLNLILGHSDKMAGSRRLGEFIAYQGVLISIPIVWLSIWLFLERNHPIFSQQYEQWFIPHLALLAIALAVSWMNFIRPLLMFAAKFRQQKQQNLAKWQRVSKTELTIAQRKLGFANSVDEANRSLNDISRITAFSERLFALPEIPLRSSVSGIFSAATLFPVATFVLDQVLPENAQLGKILGNSLSVLGKLLGLST